MGENILFLYHGVPEKIVGDKIVPLTTLEESSPELCEKYHEKYSWRPHIKNQEIPPLSCKWNDVVFLLPIHPREIRDMRISLNLPWKRSRFFVIPHLAIEPILTTIWFFEGVPRKNFVEYNEDNLKKSSVLSDLIIGAYRDLLNTGKRPRVLWWRIPHVLYKGEIPWRELTIVEV